MNGTTESYTIGVLGAGAMGGAIARRLLGLGRSVLVCDADTSISKALAEEGALIGDVKAVAKSELVVISLPSMREIGQILPTLVGAAAAETLVVNVSTIAPSEAMAIDQTLQEAGIEYLDAPVARSTADALEGRLIVLAGGRPEVLRRAEPLLKDIAETTVVCGDVGAGTTMKLINNLCNQTILFATAEAFVFGEATGLPRELVNSVLCMTNADNGHLRRTFPAKVFAGDYAPGFPLRLSHKDLTLAVAAANAAGVPVLVSAAAVQAAALGVALGAGNLDSSAYHQVLSRVVSNG